MMVLFFNWYEKIVDKGENVEYQHVFYTIFVQVVKGQDKR